jgi:hypothetical protein
VTTDHERGLKAAFYLTALVGTKLINLARHGHKLHVCEEHFRKGSLQ